MKKLIMISVIFALVVGAAFAEATLGGQLQIGTMFLQGVTEGSDKEKNEINMGPIGFHEAKMSAVFGDSKGGGKLVFVGSDPDGTAYNMRPARGKAGGIWTWGFLYWRPVTQFRMQVGLNADGDFGAAQISGWGFTGEAKNSVAAVNDYEDWGGRNTGTPLWIWQSALTRPGSAFYPGTGDLANVNFQLFPVDGLTITFVLPIGAALFDGADGAPQYVGAQLADFQLNVKYAIEEVGLLNLSFVGKGGLGSTIDAAGETVKKDKTNSVGNLYASFYLTSIENIKLELGLVYNIPWKDEATDKSLGGYVGAGLGLIFDTGDAFNVKFRANARFGGTEDGISGNRTGLAKGADNYTLVYANVLPCYKINNNLFFFFYAGMGMESHADLDDPILSWFVNPYIWVRASEGLRFWAGLRFVQKDVQPDNDKNPIRWMVPFGFNFYF